MQKLGNLAKLRSAMVENPTEMLAERVGDIFGDSRNGNVHMGFARDVLRSRDLAISQ